MKKFLCVLALTTAVCVVDAVVNPQKYLRLVIAQRALSGSSKNGLSKVIVPTARISAEQQKNIALQLLEDRYYAYRVRLSLQGWHDNDTSELTKGEAAGQEVNDTIACCKNLVLNSDGSCTSNYFKKHSKQDVHKDYNCGVDLRTNNHCLCYQDRIRDRLIGERFALFLSDVVAECPQCMPKVLALHALSKK